MFREESDSMKTIKYYDTEFTVIDEFRHDLEDTHTISIKAVHKNEHGLISILGMFIMYINKKVDVKIDTMLLTPHQLEQINRFKKDGEFND
jgi:hypothetical protein